MSCYSITRTHKEKSGHLDVDLIQPWQRMNCGPFDSAPVFLYLMIDWSIVIYRDEVGDHPVR